MYQHLVYSPRKKNRKSAKIIPKIDEALVTQEVYFSLSGLLVSTQASVVRLRCEHGALKTH